MTVSEIAAQAAIDPHTLNQIERLLLKYPKVDDSELHEITSFLRDGTILEIGLLSRNSDAWRNAEAIRAAHPHRFATTAREKLLLGVGISAIVLVPLLLWALAT